MTTKRSKKEIQESLDLIQESLLYGCPGYSRTTKQCICDVTVCNCRNEKAFRLLKKTILDQKLAASLEEVECAASIAIPCLLIPCNRYGILQDLCDCPESKRQKCKFYKAADLINETIREIKG